MAKRQKSNRNREESYAQRRQKLAEIQYEHLVERHVIRPSNSHYRVLDEYAHKANNVYNQALYRVRQALFDGRWMTYSQLDKSLKKSRDQKDCMIYSSMNSVHLVQQILRLVAQNMTSWKKARDAYRKAPHKFTGRPKLPGYYKKGGRSTIFIDNQTAKLHKGGYVEIPVLDNFRIELQHKETTAIQQVRIIPQHGRFIVEVVYRTNKEITYKPDNGRYLSIDPGLDNAFALASNVDGFQPVLINGRPIKALNQYYNKERARLYQAHDFSNQPRSSRRLERLEFFRDQKIARFAHEASRRIVDIALSHDIATIVIGKNKGQKRSCHMGKRINQNFIGIPHQVMVNRIKYKANLEGIVVIETEESYTSQTSFLDHEMPVRENGDKMRKKQGKSPARRRIKRGLGFSINGAFLKPLKIQVVE
ncbi:RNA-guided endonuclease InsQ/TnpB family protein, partial [Dubosiella newyorkensis]|uniref:RNA-guided endonuclease InsQ/TnpB family protein n=1 Tax=Dubosiella newyorkensis TaxID=1862672 RepID=UPI0023F56C9E